MVKYKIDLHTHSILSYDGGISRQEYIDALKNNTLDYIAITDHNEIDFALKLNKEYPENIIVGEEVMTNDGEIIGLFLTKHIPKHLSVPHTIELIKEQGGLVYIPHPFDLLRAGLGEDLLNKHLKDIDIIEIFNARTKLTGFDKTAKKYAEKHNLVSSSSTDAHIYITLGKAYNIVDGPVLKDNLISRLKDGDRKEVYATALKEKLSPVINVIKNIFRKRR
jgi:predicted metal-dependent phosphoesterase TrpH